MTLRAYPWISIGYCIFTLPKSRVLRSRPENTSVEAYNVPERQKKLSKLMQDMYPIRDKGRESLM